MTRVLNTRPVDPKVNPLRDRAYLDWLRTQPCVITGHVGNMHMSVDPAHIGTLGRGVKSPDDETLPLRHDLHAHLAHQKGEISFWRYTLSDSDLRSALRAWARERYREYKASINDGGQNG